MPPIFYELLPLLFIPDSHQYPGSQRAGKKGRVVASHWLKPDVLGKATNNKKQTQRTDQRRAFITACCISWGRWHVGAFPPTRGRLYCSQDQQATLPYPTLLYPTLSHRTGKEGNAPKQILKYVSASLILTIQLIKKYSKSSHYCTIVLQGASRTL